MTSGSPSDFVRDASCATCTNTKSTPLASGDFLVGFNLFRVRDSLRQDIIDQSQLIAMMSPNPACSTSAAPTAANTCANFFITPTTGVQIDPSKIYMTGQSLGSIALTADAAANPRVAKVALNVAGGTIVDVYSQGSYATKLDALLATQGLDPISNPNGYLQFLNVAKWAIDPADPLNFAPYLATNTIAGSPLGPSPASRPTMAQMALCDATVPNAQNLEQYGLTALSGFTTFVKGLSAAPACPANSVNHGFITDWTDYGNTTNFPNANITQQAQDDIAAFFASGTVPPAARAAY
jgi:hypothetical protein